MMKYLLIFAFFAVTLNEAFAADPFNTLRWNRKNALAGNGKVDTRLWFEWWYYKVVLPETGKSFYFVYGAVNPWDKNHTLKGTRAYVGMGDFNQKLIAEEKYPIAQFSSKYDETYTDVKGNIATDKNLKGDLRDEQGRPYSWNIDIEKRWAYNATGWSTGTGITNLDWYPAQADARCSGTISSNGKNYNFKNAPCYQDRNWGVSFPKWWTWIVSNQFEGYPDTSLAVGGGLPLILGHEIIEGVSIGLKHKGKEYTFRPNYADKVKIDINWGKWEATGFSHNLKDKIVITASAPKEKFMDLQFTTPEGETFHDYETLTGFVNVKLYEKKAGQWVLTEDLNSNYAGIEYGSRDVQELHSAFNEKRTLFETP